MLYHGLFNDNGVRLRRTLLSQSARSHKRLRNGQSARTHVRGYGIGGSRRREPALKGFCEGGTVFPLGELGAYA